MFADKQLEKEPHIFAISGVHTDSQKSLANLDAVLESRRPQFHFQEVDLLDEKKYQTNA